MGEKSDLRICLRGCYFFITVVAHPLNLGPLARDLNRLEAVVIRRDVDRVVSSAGDVFLGRSFGNWGCFSNL